MAVVFLRRVELVRGRIGQHRDRRMERGRRVGTSGSATVGELPGSFDLALFTDYAYHISQERHNLSRLREAGRGLLTPSLNSWYDE